MKKKIKQHNSQDFLDDLKSATQVMVYATNTRSYLTTSKKELMREAETRKIKYYLTREIFKVGRLVMAVF